MYTCALFKNSHKVQKYSIIIITYIGNLRHTYIIHKVMFEKELLSNILYSTQRSEIVWERYNILTNVDVIIHYLY